MKTLALILLLAMPAAGQVRLRWDRPPASLGAVGGYAIFRSETAHQYTTPLHPWVIVFRAYEDRTAEPGKTYHYLVLVLDGSGKPIGNSREITLVAPALTVPPKPDPCVVTPAAVSGSQWPGSRTGKFSKMVLTDDRGCTVTIVR